MKGNIRQVRCIFTLYKGCVDLVLGMVVGEEKRNLMLNSHSTWKEKKGYMMDISLGRTPKYENLKMDLSFNTM